MEKLVIYTDGGCSGNPGPGGWAFVILDGNREIAFSGSDRYTTNNKMELTAVISALKYVILNFPDAEAAVYTDSEYVKNGITQWIKKWLINGWRTADKKPVKNMELWQQLYDCSNAVNPSWHWVKGHAGNKYNELCDSMVRKEMEGIS